MNFQSKVCDDLLDEYLAGLSRDLDTFDSPVDLIFDFPISWGDMIAPPLLSMSVIALRDACVLKISVHASCDVTGLVLDRRLTMGFSKSTSIGPYNIIQAYYSLLRRESVKPLTPRSAIKLAD